MATDIKQKLVKGLTSNPRHIPMWYNYDYVGSQLEFKLLMGNPDFYSTRSQMSVLQQNVQEIIPQVPDNLILAELGSGNCFKTRYVINELLKRQQTLLFYPEDISEEFLSRAVTELSTEYGESLITRPIFADHEQGMEELKKIEGTKLILWFNGLFNLSYDDQVKTLRELSTMMTDKCRLVFNADITLDKDVILKAYNDQSGLNRTLMQNGLLRLNKEQGSHIDLTNFTFEVDFISDTNPHYMSFVRTYITAKEDIRYPIPGLGIDLVMEKGERLYLHEGEGYSCKYTLEQLQNIVKKAGLRLEDTWTDSQQHAIFCRCTSVSTESSLSIL